MIWNKQKRPSVPNPVTGFLLALNILILDQITKWLILEFVMRDQVQPNAMPMDFWDWMVNPPSRMPFASVEVLPFFNLTMVWNEGISFGMFQGTGPWILITIALAITVLFSVWMIKVTGWLQMISLAMVIGGAIGNVIDRFRFGAVADFFDFHVMGWHYPAFNIADCGITLGVILLLIDNVFLEPKRKPAMEKITEGAT
jgi:signal peptidase II